MVSAPFVRPRVDRAWLLMNQASAASAEKPAALSTPIIAGLISNYEHPFANVDFAVALTVSSS
jgi:hypothetical protein